MGSGTTEPRAAASDQPASTDQPGPTPASHHPDPSPPDSPASLRTGPGVSRLRISPGFPLRVVDGLLTGLHEPEASHLDLLGAFLDSAALERAYAAALDAGYLWHEFGDVCLLLPRRT